MTYTHRLITVPSSAGYIENRNQVEVKYDRLICPDSGRVVDFRVTCLNGVQVVDEHVQFIAPMKEGEPKKFTTRKTRSFGMGGLS